MWVWTKSCPEFMGKRKFWKFYGSKRHWRICKNKCTVKIKNNCKKKNLYNNFYFFNQKLGYLINETIELPLAAQPADLKRIESRTKEFLAMEATFDVITSWIDVSLLVFGPEIKLILFFPNRQILLLTMMNTFVLYQQQFFNFL